MSIRTRLTLWYSAVLGVTVVAFCIAIYALVSFFLYNGEKREMESLSRQVRSEINLRVGWSFFLGPRVAVEFPELDEFGYSGYFLQLVDREGRVLQRTTRDMLPIPSGAANGDEMKEAFFMERNVSPYTLLIYNEPIFVPTSAQTTEYAGFLQVATTMDDLHRTLANLRSVLTLTALAAVALASTLGWFLARKALQPIEVVMRSADSIGQGEDLSHRIEYRGPQDEIGRLTGTINGMLSRIQSAYGELEEAVRSQRRFVSDASHELRTPLTTIRGNVELLEKMWRRWREQGALRDIDEEQAALALESVRDIAGEAERMCRLVNDMLMLARADAGHKMRLERIELSALVEEVARKAVHLPRTAEWIVGDLTAIRGAYVVGDADMLRQLMFIFIENAFKYTPSGEVELSARTSADGASVGLRFRDTGIGLDKEQVPLIFERFYRADASRGETSGTGLGLSIARWIIDEHRGSIEVLTRRGEGSSFIVWLPIAPEGEAALDEPDVPELT
ncbi:ATP-binding protein [Paenibacillus sp. TRM 82003]|nr:ATP-binding protein [Paenibacillus sp. TRM 82003]